MCRKSFSLVEGAVAMAVIAIAVVTVMSAFHSGLNQIRSEKQRLVAYFLAQEEMERLSDQSMCYVNTGLGANCANWSYYGNVSYNAANGAFVGSYVAQHYYYNFTRKVNVACPYLGGSSGYGAGNGLTKGVTVSVSYACGMGAQETCYCVLSSAVANNIY